MPTMRTVRRVPDAEKSHRAWAGGAFLTLAIGVFCFGTWLIVDLTSRDETVPRGIPLFYALSLVLLVCANVVFDTGEPPSRASRWEKVWRIAFVFAVVACAVALFLAVMLRLSDPRGL